MADSSAFAYADPSSPYAFTRPSKPGVDSGVKMAGPSDSGAPQIVAPGISKTISK